MPAAKKVKKTAVAVESPVVQPKSLKNAKVAEVEMADDFMDLDDEDDFDEEDLNNFLANLEEDDEDFEDEDAEMSPELEAALQKLAKSLHTSTKKVALDPKERREAFIAKRAKVHTDGGVVVISRLPYGFFEDQLKSFFSQFGVVRKLRLSRNKKTGKSRHFAFMEFDNKEVAAIVADTMDGYMMFGRTMQCKYIPPQHVHPDTFRNHHKNFKVIPWNRIERQKHNAERTEEQIDKLQNRLKSNEKKRRDKLAALGYDYDFAGFEGKAMVAAKPKAVKKTKATAKVSVVEKEVVKTVKKSRKAAAMEEDITEVKAVKKTRKAASPEVEVAEAKPTKKARKVTKK